MVVGLLVALIAAIVIMPLNLLVCGFLLIRYKHSSESVKTPEKANTEVAKSEKPNNIGNEEQSREMLDILDEYLNGGER